MRRLVVLALALVLLGAPAKAQVTLALSCGAVGTEFELCREGAEEWARRTGNRIRMVSMPAGGSERLALLQQLLASRSANLDVIQADVVWPGLLANHLLDLSGRVETEGHFPTILANNTVDGRLLAVPWFTNTGLLYYRRDLLERHGRRVPETWAELTETAAAVMQAERAAGSERMWGYVFQARAYEGLTVNALEWLAAHGAGTVVEPDGRISVDNPRAAQAITLAARWIGAIAPQGVLNYTEEEARGVFQSGQAVFMRNWPYASPLLQAPDSPVRGMGGVNAPAADGERPARRGAGGENLAVSLHGASGRRGDLAAGSSLARRAAAPCPRAGPAADHPGPLRGCGDALARSPCCAQPRPRRAGAVPAPRAATGVRYNRVSARIRERRHAGALRPARRRRKSLERLEARARASAAAEPGRMERKRRRAAWLFLAPALAALGLVAGWPLARTVWFAFTDATLFDLAYAALHRIRELPLAAVGP
jgi:trehalose/maltose transport system substrate-binding protein